MEYLLLLIAYLVFCEIIAPILRDMAILLAVCMGYALKGVCIGAWWLLGQFAIATARLAVSAGHSTVLGLMLVCAVADECWRGAQEEEQPDAEQEDSAGDDEEPSPDLYAEAMALLGLAPGFDEADLKRAYKRVIRRAHPDAGGSVEEAKEVNLARDLVAQCHGWK
jgi:hypothetical protein